MAQKLAKLGVKTLTDLWFHLPYRYEDRTKVWPIASLLAGQSATVQGEIISSSISQGQRKMLTVFIRDNSASLTLRFFHFTAAIHNNFQHGKKNIAFGEIKKGMSGLEIIHPEYKISANETSLSIAETLTPIYPTTEGLRQATLRSIVEKALVLLDESSLEELMPSGLYDNQLTLVDALHILHNPAPGINLSQLEQHQHPAQQRLILEELLAQNLSMLAVRSKLQQDNTYSLSLSQKLKPKLLKALPFSPTKAQLRVVADIEADLQKNKPMMRLVQGDVGSGKTLVAALSALHAIEQGYQVALMAPTEILAEQHALNFTTWFAPA